MDTIFIEARSKLDPIPPVRLLKPLPHIVGLCTTVQHIHKIAEIRESIEKTGRTVVLLRGSHSRYPGQVLGCDILASPIPDAESYLFVGSGEFHAIQIAMATHKPVYIYHPGAKKIEQLTTPFVERYERLRKGSLLRFGASSVIGVLVSTKPGQCRLADAKALAARYPDKDFTILLFNTLEPEQLANFPFIQCFVNTACPRIATDDAERIPRPIVNIDDIV